MDKNLTLALCLSYSFVPGESGRSTEGICANRFNVYESIRCAEVQHLDVAYIHTKVVIDVTVVPTNPYEARCTFLLNEPEVKKFPAKSIFYGYKTGDLLLININLEPKLSTGLTVEALDDALHKADPKQLQTVLKTRPSRVSDYPYDALLTYAGTFRNCRLIDTFHNNVVVNDNPGIKKAIEQLERLRLAQTAQCEKLVASYIANIQKSGTDVPHSPAQDPADPEKDERGKEKEKN